MNRYAELAEELMTVGKIDKLMPTGADEQEAEHDTANWVEWNRDDILAALKIAAESEWHKIDPADEGTWPPESQIVQISFPGFATTVAHRSANFFDNGNWPEAVRIERVLFWKHLDAGPDAKGA